MLDFQKTTLADKEWVDSILKESKGISSDSTFGCMYVWQDTYELKIAQKEGFLFRFYEKYGSYGYPIGNGDKEKAIETVSEDAKKRGIKLRFIGVTQGQANILNEIMPDKFLFIHDRTKDEYIYKTTDLIHLKGKKYHSKRNHISKFMRNHSWSYESITEGNIDECRELVDVFFKENGGESAEERGEKQAIMLALMNFERLDFLGGLIKVKGVPVAFTMGEKINDSVFATHFEKAIRDYREAYTVINNEFAKAELQGYDFVNREEDLGIEGLRKAKLSYSPITLLNKYEVEMKGEQ